MRALVWHGRHDMRVDTIPDPVRINPRDAIIKVTSTAICGSDLHIYNGLIPSMKSGDVLGHEFMGEVVDVDPSNTKLKVKLAARFFIIALCVVAKLVVTCRRALENVPM